MKKLVLIDGNAIMHRAYHALPGFTSKSGKPTGAIFGFTSMLLKIIQDLAPTHIICAFDRPEPTFRQQLYVEYQAHRPRMDGELAEQLEGIHTLVEAFGIPIFEVDGYEADDVIGTLAYQAVKNKDAEVVIVTGDRDMLQLVNSHVRVYAPIKGLSEAKMFDENAVIEKYGIKSSQFIDLKSLMGDSSDNYKGVPGIGPKTASELIQKFNTLENIYKNLGEVTEKQRKYLSEGAESAALAKQLATIHTDVPIHLDWKKSTFDITNIDTVVETLRVFDFTTLTNRFLVIMGKTPLEIPKIVEKADKKAKNKDQLELI